MMIDRKKLLLCACGVVLVTVVILSNTNLGLQFRAYKVNISLPAPVQTKPGFLHDKWIVITTISPPTKDVIFNAGLPGWKVVVVGDRKTPANWKYRNCYFLDLEKQKNFPFRITKLVPEGSYTRKNIGYLFAIHHGAKVIYETDDDNRPLDKLKNFIYEPQTRGLMYAGGPLFNPYRHFGQPSLWPRGYPLSGIGKNSLDEYMLGQWDTPTIQQGLVNGDPDMDAIFRLTRKETTETLNVSFNSAGPPAFLPSGVFSPFNSQNTLFLHKAFWALLLPVTTTFRMCDIWRGYWAQRLLWEIGGSLAFIPPNAFQKRNAHSYLKDAEDEKMMYFNTEKLIDFLTAWKCPDHFSFFDCLVELTSKMADAGFWGSKEVQTARAWVSDLKFVGYTEPLRRLTNATLSTLSFLKSQPITKNVVEDADLSKRINRVYYVGKEEDPPLPHRLCTGKCDSHGNKYLPNQPSYNPAFFRQIRLVQKLCPNMTIELNKQTMEKVDTFPNILLIVEFNHAHYGNIRSLDILYRAKFPYILYCGEGYEKFVRMLPTLPRPATFIEANFYRGHFGYECTIQAMNMNFRVDGYMYLSDDVLLNTWNIKKLPVNKNWETWDISAAKVQISQPYRWSHWKGNRVLLNDSFNEMEDLIETTGDKFLKKVYSGLRKNLKIITGKDDGAVKCGADFSYTPAIYKKEYLTIAEIFRKHTVFLEVATCILASALAPRNETIRVPVNYLWFQNRTYFNKSYKPTNIVQHPIKFTGIYKFPEGQQLMCRKYFPRFFNLV